jgi:hypothetical protein
LKNSNSGPRGGGGLLRWDLLVIETTPQVFKKIKQVEKGVLMKSLFLNTGAKIKEKEKGVSEEIKQGMFS